MSENIRNISLLESFETYESHGEIKITLELFPELASKSNAEIDTWLNANYSNLYINRSNGELRRNKPVKPPQETPKFDQTTSRAPTPLAPAVVKVLQRFNRPMKVTEILVGLEQDDYVFGRGNPKQSLYVRIGKLSGVKRHSEGFYVAANLDPEKLEAPVVVSNDDDSEYEDPDDIIELSEYWNNCEVVWDKIKNEKRTMMIQ